MGLGEVCQAVSEWIEKQVKAAGANGVVIGLSGGVDSAVVATLASGATDVTGLILPCESSYQDIRLAEQLARKVGIRFYSQSLTQGYETLLSPLEANNEVSEMARANLKSRLRMAALYFYANATNRLVCGTTNKSEAMLGYYTKYGDGGVDIEPVADLFKTDIYSLAEWLYVPFEIIDRPPSAGLWHGQTDEEEMGYTYKELDPILRCLSQCLSWNLREPDLSKYLREHAQEFVRKNPEWEDPMAFIVETIIRTAHKREMPPAPSIRHLR